MSDDNHGIKIGIKIQCPDCGNRLHYLTNEHLLKLTPNKPLLCVDCEKLFSESKIRERCAL